MDYRVRRTFFPSECVFLPCDHGLDFLYGVSAYLRKQSINQSIITTLFDDVLEYIVYVLFLFGVPAWRLM